MLNTKDSVTTLLDQVDTKLVSNTFYISMYVETRQHHTHELVIKHVKAQLLNGLRNRPKLAHLTQMHTLLVREVITQVSQLDQIPNGLALFIKLKANQLNRSSTINPKSLTINCIQLNKAPKKDIHIGKTYDLDQLVWIQNTTYQAVVVKISTDESSIYELDNNLLNPLKVISNTFKQLKSNEYLEKKSPTRQDVAYFGTGNEKANRRISAQNQQYLNQVSEYLTTNFGNRVDYILVYYPIAMTESVNPLIEHVQGLMPDTKVVGSTDNIQSEQDLLSHAANELQSYHQKIKQELLELSKEQFNVYAQGWKQVTKAARMQKIDILFILVGSIKTGYLLNRSFVYTYPVKGSKKVRNIAPWLVKQVIEAGGKVVSVHDPTLMPKSKVSARLRY